MARKFAPGNGFGRGRPKGARNRATLAAETLLDGEAEALTRKAIELAKSGDSAALRLCLERILPPRRERLLDVQLPPLETADDAVKAMGAVVHAIAEGHITAGEAKELAGVVAAFRHALADEELERRIAALEKRVETP
ncbi:MAG: hypothetical protein HQL36_01860 [Alphaproteobacteria bacterium]|nr:hypothetical protein [Alphaproteobacteria bacterium]